MATREFSIDNFMSRVDNLGGPAKRNKFSVEVTKKEVWAHSGEMF